MTVLWLTQHSVPWWAGAFFCVLLVALFVLGGFMVREAWREWQEDHRG